MTRVGALLRRLLPAGAAVLSVLIFASYVMGLVRDRIFARTFGASSELDAYNAAFVLPELLFDVLVEAGLAAAFIPIFLRLRAADADPEESNRFARTILTVGVAVMGVGSLVLFVFAEATTAFIAPGFAGEQRELYVALFRVMLITQVLFAASLTLGQVLLAEQRYFWYGIAPLLYNAGIVLGTVTLSGELGIFGPAMGAIIGASLHLGSRFIGLRKSSLRIRFAWQTRISSVREFARLTLPKLVSQPVEPIVFLFFTNVASGLAPGSVSVFNYARNFQSVPVSLVGVAFAIAAFPALSTAYATDDRRGFLRLFGANLGRISGLTVIAAIAMVLVGEIAVRILLGGGAFGPDDVALTATVLGAFALSVPFESVAHLLSRAIYATRHTLLQALASIAGLLVTVAATLAMVDEFGLVALPLGFAVGQAAKVALLALALAVRLSGWSKA
ncbi:MAG: lipid II flippase MurJ [Candidatus Limnocylindria bacterium]